MDIDAPRKIAADQGNAGAEVGPVIHHHEEGERSAETKGTTMPAPRDEADAAEPLLHQFDVEIEPDQEHVHTSPIWLSA